MNTDTRTGESEKLWYRSDRFFIVNNQWYFTTREKIDVGPFNSGNSAEQGLELFIKAMNAENPDKHVAAKVAIEGQWSQTLYH